MRLPLILLSTFSFTLAPAYAEDMFTYFERGSWGNNQIPHATCETNPAKISFSADRTRAIFTLSSAAIDYRGQANEAYGYDIFSFDEDGIVMQLDDEQRLTPDGEAMIWVLKPLPKDMYCWGRKDWPSTGCIHINVRCPERPPIS